MESTHSRQQKSIDSTYPLPSLCSSISSSNSTLHDMSTTTIITNTTTTTNTTNNDINNNQLPQPQQQPHQRWDESQLALELADDAPVPEHKSFKQSAKHLKHKILKSFQPTEQESKSIRYKKWKQLLLKS